MDPLSVVEIAAELVKLVLTLVDPAKAHSLLDDYAAVQASNALADAAELEKFGKTGEPT